MTGPDIAACAVAASCGAGIVAVIIRWPRRKVAPVSARAIRNVLDASDEDRTR